jgi:hypothetical protein
LKVAGLGRLDVNSLSPKFSLRVGQGLADFDLFSVSNGGCSIRT